MAESSPFLSIIYLLLWLAILLLCLAVIHFASFFLFYSIGWTKFRFKTFSTVVNL